MDNRRLFLALALSFGVLVAWSVLFPPAEPPAVPEPAAVEAQSAPQRADGAGEPAAESPAAAPGEPVLGEPAAGETPSGETAAAPQVEEPAAGVEPVPREPISAESEQRVVVENERFRAVLSNRGGVVEHFLLKDHQAMGEEGGLVDLVRRRAAGPYPFALIAPDRQPLALDDALFAVTETTLGADGRRVEFRYAGSEGVAEKIYVFEGDGTFHVDVRVERPSDWLLWVGPGLRNPIADESESRLARRGAVWLQADDLERQDSRKADEEVAVSGAGLAWIGLDDQYFLTAQVPDPEAPLRGALYAPYLMEPAGEGSFRFAPLPVGDLNKAEKDEGREYALLLEPGGPRMAFDAYWGAKSIQRLEAAGRGLDRSVNLRPGGPGFLAPVLALIGWLARFFLEGLLLIHAKVIANYGWSIVLLTAAIKLFLLPLTHKSFVSMRKMQALAPKMKAIRERYRPKLKDKKGRPDMEMQRKMNEEIMALYKSEGVNPAGGCLPMILQLPVFFAFYRVLYSAVELRGAPWMLWIGDLSVADPIYALPIIMGATQFLQQRMTPTSGDPIQRRMFQLMPIFMTVLFLGFPAGLVLYWLTNNVLTIAQQGLYTRFFDKDSKEARAKGQAKGKSGNKR